MPYVHANGIRLYYERAGEGIPLLLHAHHHNKYMPFQLPYFSQYYDVIVPDRRGTGRSDDPPGPWSAADLAADLRGLLDALGIERAIVGGNSLGGVVSAQFGLDYPDRAHALIVGHTVPYLWPLGAEWLTAQINAVRERKPVIVNQPRSYEWEPEGPPTVDPAFVASLPGQFLATLNKGIGGSVEGAVAALEVLQQWDQRLRYAEHQALDLPVLVIVGANEPQKTLELAHEWSQQFKRADFVVLRNTHHDAGNENPLAWNTAVHQFLQRNGF